MNYEKSEIMPLRRIKHKYKILAPENRIKWTEGPIRSLGIEICDTTEDLIKLNYTKALAKMKNVLQIWDKRYLTLYGKIIILNSFVISQFVYLMSVLPSPSNEMIIDIEKIDIYGMANQIK